MKIYGSIKKLRQMLMIMKVDNKNVLNSLRPITKVNNWKDGILSFGDNLPKKLYTLQYDQCLS